MAGRYFKPEQFWTTLAAVIVGGIAVGVVVYGMNPLDNIKKVTVKPNSEED
jgi:hypothetical protein